MRFHFYYSKQNFREIFLGNLVSQVITTPQFEDSIETVEDFLKQNMTLFSYRSSFESRKKWLLSLNDTLWTQVVDNMA